MTPEDQVRDVFVDSGCPLGEFTHYIRAQQLRIFSGDIFCLDWLIFGKDFLNFLLITKINAVSACIFQCSDTVSQFYKTQTG